MRITQIYQNTQKTLKIIALCYKGRNAGNIENHHKISKSLSICYNKYMNKEMMLYIHIPFCVRKCAYCDFLSFAVEENTMQRYLEVLLREVKEKGKEYRSKTISSIFIGGGTPSLLSGAQVKMLMDSVRGSFSVQEGAEITIECNPGTLTEEKANAYYNAGINRISFGLQSSNDEELRLLGRIHTYHEFENSYNLARKAGFTNINVDLMGALPKQTKEGFLSSLEKVILHNPEHISMYSLIVEPGTPFYEKYSEGASFEEDLPSEETERGIYYAARDVLKVHGYEQYEISNFAKTGYACKHNLGYWERKEYLGVGLGASSLIENRRFKNTESLNTYLKSVFSPNELQELSISEQMEEYMFLGLRKTGGVSIKKFQNLYGKKIETIYGTWIQKMKKDGLLLEEGERLLLSLRGMDLANYVMQGFLLE